MERKFTIFEMTENGPRKVDCIRGLDAAIQRVRERGATITGEIRVVYLPDNLTVATVNRTVQEEAA